MKKFSELQENLKWQYNDFRNKINKQKEYFTKETEILKKNQTILCQHKNRHVFVSVCVTNETE